MDKSVTGVKIITALLLLTCIAVSCLVLGAHRNTSCTFSAGITLFNDDADPARDCTAGSDWYSCEADTVSVC